MTNFDSATVNVRKIQNQMEYQYRKKTQNTPEIYPWNNHDFDYQQVVKNKYSPEKLGISERPCIDVTINDAINLPKYSDILVSTAIPDKNTKSGESDIDTQDTSTSQYKKLYKAFPEPYPGFKKEYPEYFPYKVSGEYSSSYFVKTGWCPVSKIKNEKECQDKKFTWINNQIPATETNKTYFSSSIQSNGGSCFKPRYTFVDNKSGDYSGLFDGLIPSLEKDLIELNPMNMMSIFMNGNTSDNSFKQLECKETFNNYNNLPIDDSNLIIKIFIFIIVLILIIYMCFFIK